MHSVMLVDDDPKFLALLARDFESRGTYRVATASRLESVASILKDFSPGLIVSEQQLRDGDWQALWRLVGGRDSQAQLVIATAFASIAGAVTAMRAGAAAYISKPATVANILDALSDGRTPARDAKLGADEYLSLNRAKWEYIHMVLAAAGTLSEAARRLGLDRRSLRRMLSQHTPA